MIRVFQCEDTLTGIMTGVYDAWDSRLGHDHVKLQIAQDQDMELFCEYVLVMPDLLKAEKVLRTVRKRLGEEAYEMIAYAASYPDGRKADAIYRMIVLGLHLPAGRQIGGMLTHPDVRLVFELKRKAWHITHRYLGFVRFRELENKVLFSEIAAEADVLALIAPHFADRLPMENWVIYDRNRQKAAMHLAGKGFLILEEVSSQEFAETLSSQDEDDVAALWKTFHQVIGIEERNNDRLQMSFLPKKYRQFMNEFCQTKTDA